jgi:hypothetical protein
MIDNDSEERATAGCGGQPSARPGDASSVQGEQTEASATASASVETSLITTGYIDLARDRSDLYVFAPDQLLSKRGKHTRWYADGEEDTPKLRGRPEEGITEREEIIAALVGYSGTVRCTIKHGEIRPRKASLKRFRTGLGGSVDGINTIALAEFFEVTPRTITDWRTKTSENASLSRGDDLTPATQADVEAVRELVADTNEKTNAILELLLEEFPGNTMVARSIDRFVDATLDAPRVDAD